MAAYLYFNTYLWLWDTNLMSSCMPPQSKGSYSPDTTDINMQTELTSNITDAEAKGNDIKLHDSVYPYENSSGITKTSDYWVSTFQGKIKAIGCDNPPLDGEYLEKIDCMGQCLIPGLMDSHIHVAMTGESKYFVDLQNCRSIEDLQEALRRHIEIHQDIHWIQGINWDQSQLGRYPTRYDIDAVCADKPIFLWRACWHIGVLNTKGLVICELDRADENFSRSIEGGSIDLDNRGPTGVLRERATELVVAKMGQKSMTERRKFITDGLEMCLSQGLTGVQTNDERSYQIYRSLRDEQALHIRVFLTPNHHELYLSDKEDGIDQLKPFNYMKCTEKICKCSHSSDGSQPEITCCCVYPADHPMSFLAVDRVKVYSDGSLGAETAAIRLLPDPASSQSSDGNIKSSSSGESQYKGILIQSEKSLKGKIIQAKDKGYRLEIHAIGDAAAEQVITTYDKAGITTNDRAMITHCQVLGPDLIDRMQEIGIIANIQPSFVPTDMRWVSERISTRQQKSSYAWRTLMMNDVHVCGGSDSPIETCSPLIGMYDAIFRHNRNDIKDIFRPEECLSFDEALWIYTAGAAYAAGCEDTLGAIKEGFAADMVLIDKDIVTNPRLLSQVKPIMVIVGGKSVYKYDISTPSTIKSVEMKGPFVPGKNGSIRSPERWKCSCSIMGKDCDIIMRKDADE